MICLWKLVKNYVQAAEQKMEQYQVGKDTKQQKCFFQYQAYALDFAVTNHALVRYSCHLITAKVFSYLYLLSIHDTWEQNDCKN